MRKLLPTLAILSILLPVLAIADETVKGIAVDGTKIIERGTVQNKLTLRVNESFDPAKVAEDVKKIYRMGFFSDVYVEREEQDGGLLVRYVVREKPYIREIVFKGNKEMSEDDLRTQLSTKRYTFLDERKIKADVEKLKKTYQDKGYYFVGVKYSVASLKDKPADMQIIFDVTEGDSVKIKEIRLNGVNNFKPKKIKGQMETAEKWFLSWLTGSGTFKADELREDFERIREFYGNEGFIEAKITGHRVSLNEKKNGLIVEVDIHEGRKFTLSSVKVGGDAKEYDAMLSPKLKQKKGEVFRRTNIRDDMTLISDFMGDKGFAYANVEPMLNVSEEKSTIDLTYHVAKGKLVYINRIVIEGNSKTRDQVIRREFSLVEGDLFNASKLKKSRNKVNRLGFFEEVNAIPRRVEYEKPEKDDEDLMDLLIKIKERPTGYLTFGLGYSSIDQFIGSLQISQNNLFGRGQKLSAQVQASSRSQTYSISFLEPYLFGYPVSGGFDLFKTVRKYTDYAKESTGFGLRSGYRINEDWNTSVGYRYENSTVYDVASTASLLILDQVGTSLTSSMYGTITRDTRNDAFYATDGSLFSFTQEVAGGVLGGDNYFLKSTVDGAVYFQMPWEHSLSLHAQFGAVTGYGGREVPIYERFFLGGMYSLRGFMTRSIGPKDPVTGDVLGGNKELFGNVEYILPLIKEAGVRGVVFFDVGNAYDEGLFPDGYRRSAGMGIRWYSPMGPLRLEWGKNLSPRADERGSKWEFSIGTVF